ncbi:MAG: kynureninase [Bacteroidia bacterium]|nr:kynureninase [Bacteroidia bacterium]MDW8159310.1 kynureninase [Bacteroidia bacterium]
MQEPLRAENYAYEATLEYALSADQKDNLSSFRKEFLFPLQPDTQKPYLYFCGNSLGLQPKNAIAEVQSVMEKWAREGVLGHHHGINPWVDYAEQLSPQLAKVVGALEHEVIAMNTLTVNLHLLLATFYKPTPQRFKILIESPAFPSDRYAFVSQIQWHGYDPQQALIEVAPRPNEFYIREEDIYQAIEKNKDSLALVLLGGVNYYTGQLFNIAEVTRKAHEVGAFAGFDLAHAVGNVPLSLHEWEVDFAAWCSYKYLNGGPGCIAGIYIHERYARNQLLNRLAGWWGHDSSTRFQMGPNFIPISSAQGWQVSNPPILPLACLKASLAIFDRIGMQALRTKSILLTGYLIFLLEKLPGIQIITPYNSEQRGAQVSIHIRRDGKQLFDYLYQKGVICDWREPDSIRIAPTPLYNSYQDVFEFYTILEEGIKVYS